MSEEQTATAAPEITIGDELEESSSEFLGVIQCDTYEEGKFGLQWHLGVRPVQFALKGATGMFSTWYKPSKRKHSKMGAALEAMKNLPEFMGVMVGHHKLEGKVAWWIRRDIEFGKKDDGTPMVAEGVLIPVREATAAEKAEAASGGGPAPVIAEPEYTDSDLETLLDVYVGRTPKDAKIHAMKAAELSKELKNAVTGDSAREYLLSNNLIRLGSDGTFELVEDRGPVTA